LISVIRDNFFANNRRVDVELDVLLEEVEIFVHVIHCVISLNPNIFIAIKLNVLNVFDVVDRLLNHLNVFLQLDFLSAVVAFDFGRAELRVAQRIYRNRNLKVLSVNFIICEEFFLNILNDLFVHDYFFIVSVQNLVVIHVIHGVLESGGSDCDAIELVLTLREFWCECELWEVVHQHDPVFLVAFVVEPDEIFLASTNGDALRGSV
jgi:hypothetical protein